MVNQVIEATAKVTAKEVVAELKKQGFLTDNKPSPFRKTETLLYNYNNFLAAVKDKQEQIASIRAVGISKRSPSITSYGRNSSNEAKSDSEKAEEKIQAIEDSIKTTINFIKLIDSAINSLQNDQYFEIIKLRYFEGKTREEIAEYLGVDVSTVSRNKSRLVNLLQIRLFSDEVIKQIFS